MEGTSSSSKEPFRRRWRRRHPWKKTVLYHRAAAAACKRSSEREERSDETATDYCVTPREMIKEHFATEDLVERSECEERKTERIETTLSKFRQF